MTAMGDTTTPAHSTEHCIDSCRPLKVIVIGAGISGIISAIKLPRALERLDLVIYEKNADLGGTWFENRYPGVACGACGALVEIRFPLCSIVVCCC